MISQFAGRVIVATAHGDQTLYTVTDTGGGAFTVTLPATSTDPLATIDAHLPNWWTPPPPPAPTTIAPLAMMNRLTLTEQATMATAAQGNAQVLLWLMKMASATEIDVTDPVTIAGVQAMEAAGLFVAGRAAVVLDLSQASP